MGDTWEDEVATFYFNPYLRMYGHKGWWRVVGHHAREDRRLVPATEPWTMPANWAVITCG